MKFSRNIWVNRSSITDNGLVYNFMHLSWIWFIANHSTTMSHAPILYGCEPLHFHEAQENWQHINTLFGMVERGKKGKHREGKEAISTFWLQRWRGSGGELEWCISTRHISLSAQNGRKRRKSWNLKNMIMMVAWFENIVDKITNIHISYAQPQKRKLHNEK